MAKKRKPVHHKVLRKQEQVPPPETLVKAVKTTEEPPNIRYFSPESEEKNVDRDVTDFLLKETETNGQKLPTPKEIEEPEEKHSRDLTNWYVIVTGFVILLVLVIFLINLDISSLSNNRDDETDETETSIESPVTIPLENRSAISTTPTNSSGLRDFMLPQTELKPVQDFETLDDKKSDLINKCNDSVKCKAMLKGYTKLGIRTQSHSYTFTMDNNGKITDFKTRLDSGTDTVIDASEEDVLALYNAFAIGDEETFLLKLEKVLPPELRQEVMEGMMAG